MKCKFKKVTLKFTALALLVAPVSQYLSQENANAASISQEEVEKEARNFEKEVSPFFNLIERMPDSVAEQGIDAGVEWLNQNKTSEFANYEFINQNGSLILKSLLPESNNPNVRSLDWGACIAAVGVAVVSNAIPWAKILKVKKAAKAVGGMTKMTKMIVTAYRHQRNIGLTRSAAIKKAVSIAAKTFPEDTKNALVEFFSLAGLSACW